MSEKGRKILVAVDEGDESAHALSWCLKNLICCHNSKDTLVLLYAKQPPSVYTAVDATGFLFTSNIIGTMERLSDHVAQSVMDKATRLCQDFNVQVAVEMMVEFGDPREVICEVAEKLKVDYLVMGSHGYGLVKRAYLGSVSDHCARNVTCPVMLVKKPKSNDVHR